MPVVKPYRLADIPPEEVSRWGKLSRKDVPRLHGFYAWVEMAYGPAAREICQQRIKDLPEPGEFDPESLAWDCYCQSDPHSAEVIHKMGTRRYDSRPELVDLDLE